MRSREEVEQELQTINKAIFAIVSGAQSYTVGSRSVTKASLAELRKMRGELMSELFAIDNGGSCIAPIGWPGP